MWYNNLKFMCYDSHGQIYTITIYDRKFTKIYSMKNYQIQIYFMII